MLVPFFMFYFEFYFELKSPGGEVTTKEIGQEWSTGELQEGLKSELKKKLKIEAGVTRHTFIPSISQIQ